ncbi:MAG: acyltransferase family protein [Clostridium sp.]
MKKIYPLHIITFVFIFISNFKYVNNIRSMVLSIPNVFLLQSFIPLKSIYLGFNGVSWYISTLMFCYFISIYFYEKIMKIKSEKLLKIVIIIYTLQIIIVFIGKDTSIHHWLFYINPIFRSIDFFIGMILSRILIECKNYSTYNINYTFIEIGLVIVFIIIYLVARYVPQAFRWGVYYTPIIIAIITVFAKERGNISKFLGNIFFEKLATISFEFYMVHQIIIIKLSKYFSENQVLGILVMLILSIIVSIFIKLIFNYIRNKMKNDIKIQN